MRLHLFALRVAAGTRSVMRWWRRMLVGALSAWLVVNAALISWLVWAESQHVRYDDGAAAAVAYALLVASWPIGAALALHFRPRD